MNTIALLVIIYFFGTFLLGVITEIRWIIAKIRG